MSDGADTKKAQDTHIETGALSFIDGARAYHALKKYDQQRTKFLLETITSGALKKWVQEIAAADREHNTKQEEVLDTGGTPEWRRTLHDVSLDTNGLFIRLGSHNHGIHAHILFSSLTKESITKLHENHLISQVEMYEIFSIQGTVPAEYLTRVADGPENTYGAASSSGLRKDWDSSRSLAWVAKKVLDEPSHIFRWKGHVPEVALSRSVTAETIENTPTELQSISSRIDRLFTIAEWISNGTLVGKAEENFSRNFDRTVTLASVSKQFYENRSSTVRDPRMYEAIKILKVLLRIPPDFVLPSKIQKTKTRNRFSKPWSTTC